MSNKPPMLNNETANTAGHSEPAIPIPAAPPEMPVIVAAMYKFTELADFEALRPQLQTAALHHKIMGTILLAHEGLNGTIAGSAAGLRGFFDYLARLAAMRDIEVKFSFCAEMPFNRMKVRLKKEIVTLGQPAADPRNTVGTYVQPQDWNALISDEETLVIDTRNDYEVAIGQFANAVDPQTSTFRDFADYVEQKLKPLAAGARPKKIAMYCTGGIRCEKATSYLLQQGFENVYHLKGGILKYLETVPEKDSLWQGDCFVFDQRVSVRHGLVQGDYDMCHACRMPMSKADTQHPHYTAGISCPKCNGTHDAEQQNRFAERQKQINLAKARGESHIGQDAGKKAEKQPGKKTGKQAAEKQT